MTVILLQYQVHKVQCRFPLRLFDGYFPESHSASGRYLQSIQDINGLSEYIQSTYIYIDKNINTVNKTGREVQEKGRKL